MKPDNFLVLEFLFLVNSNIVTLPKSISSSPRLELLDIDNCKQLREIPRLPQSMGMVDARNCIGLDPKTSSTLLNQVISLSRLSYKETIFVTFPKFMLLKFLVFAKCKLYWELGGYWNCSIKIPGTEIQKYFNFNQWNVAWATNVSY